MRRYLLILMLTAGVILSLVSPANAAQVTYAGNQIASTNTHCGNGFIAHSAAGISYVLTAGHCIRTAGLSNYWVDRSGAYIGTGARYDYGQYGEAGNADAGAIRSTSALASQYRSSTGVHNYTGTRNPQVGDEVSIIRNMHNNDVVRGRVASINRTVTYSGGVVINNLACVTGAAGIGPGESGDPVLVGHVAVGILSGGGDGCIYITQLQNVLNKWSLHR